MSMSNSSGDLAIAFKPAARVMQIIVGAMFIGVVAFLCVTIFIRSSGGPPQADRSQLLTFVGIGMALAALAADWIVPSAIVKQARSKLAQGTFESAPEAPYQKLINGLGDAGGLCGVYQTKIIIGAALWEGASFVNLTAFLLEGGFVPLIPVGVALLAIAPKFPTRVTPGRVDQ